MREKGLPQGLVVTICHLLKCLRPGSRFLIGKKCAQLFPSEAFDPLI